jgi:hypothetical protein
MRGSDWVERILSPAKLACDTDRSLFSDDRVDFFLTERDQHLSDPFARAGALEARR